MGANSIYLSFVRYQARSERLDSVKILTGDVCSVSSWFSKQTLIRIMKTRCFAKLSFGENAVQGNFTR